MYFLTDNIKNFSIFCIFDIRLNTILFDTLYMGFSTLNESKLHNSLKILYQEIYDGQTEVEQDGHIYDIVSKNGNIIEIQTKNLAKLLPKILHNTITVFILCYAVIIIYAILIQSEITD